jgi:EmrB/QacA subfamily drug resistance transporter
MSLPVADDSLAAAEAASILDADRRYAWRVLSVTGLGMTLTFFSASMLPVALPDMAKDLGASASQASWFILAYLLVNSILILVIGKVADHLGRRPIYILGLSILTIASVGIGVSSSPSVVIGLRAFQGVGAAAVITNTTALLVEAFPPALLSMGIGLNIMVLSSATALGPLTGGALTQVFGWRGVFLVNLPLGLIGVVWAAITLRRAPKGAAASRRFDVLGALMSAVIIGGFVYAVNKGNTVGWTSAQVAVPGLLAIVLVPVFLRVESRAQAPIVSLALFADRFRGFAYATTFTVSLAQGAVAILVSLYLQSSRGLSPLEAGLQITPLAIGGILMAPVAGRLAARVQTRTLASVGVGVSTAAMLGLTMFMAGYGPDVALPLLLFVLGLGGGIFGTTNASAINIGVPVSQAGMANGLRVMFDNTSIVLSTAFMVVLATIFVPSADRSLVFAGRISSFDHAQLSSLTNGFTVAFAVMTALEVAGLFLSLSRGTADAALRAEVRAARRVRAAPVLQDAAPTVERVH